MERDLITLSLQLVHLQNGQDLKEVQQYLKLKYRIDVDLAVLQHRLEKLLLEEKAVA